MYLRPMYLMLIYLRLMHLIGLCTFGQFALGQCMIAQQELHGSSALPTTRFRTLIEIFRLTTIYFKFSGNVCAL